MKDYDPLQLCSTASQIVLFYGWRGFNQERIDKIWNGEKLPPSPRTIRDHILNKNIKWYIRNNIKSTDAIWNADFIMGLAQCGEITWNRQEFPNFYWHNNKLLKQIIFYSPFYGELGNGKLGNPSLKTHYSWKNVPAFYLKHSEESISFMAGVLATGIPVIINKNSYAKYNKKLRKWFKKWKIPIEIRDRHYLYISVFWTVLLTPWMPSCCEMWRKIKNPRNGEIYSLIMWRIFTGLDIKTKGIPFLISRKSYYNKYGTIKTLEKKWVKYKLVELDKRFREVVQKWQGKSV